MAEKQQKTEVNPKYRAPFEAFQWRPVTEKQDKDRLKRFLNEYTFDQLYQNRMGMSDQEIKRDMSIITSFGVMGIIGGGFLIYQGIKNIFNRKETR